MVVGTATATATAAVSRRLAVSRMGLLSGTLRSGPTNVMANYTHSPVILLFNKEFSYFLIGKFSGRLSFISIFCLGMI